MDKKEVKEKIDNDKDSIKQLKADTKELSDVIKKNEELSKFIIDELVSEDNSVYRIIIKKGKIIDKGYGDKIFDSEISATVSNKSAAMAALSFLIEFHDKDAKRIEEKIKNFEL